MSQICDGYSSNSLMGNWFQQKYAPEQASKKQNMFRPIKNIDPNISFADKFGNLIPLQRIKRLQPWNTEGVISNYGIKQNCTTMKTHINRQNLQMFSKLQDQRSIIKQYGSTQKLYPDSNKNYLQLKPTPSLKMFGNHNVHQLNVDRGINNNSSFKSNLVPKTNEQQIFYGQTTYDKYYGRGQINNRKKELQKKTEVYAKNKIVGQKLKLQDQPKNNTFVQRSWYPAGDKGLYYGTQDRIVCVQQKKQKKKQNFRKIRSQITLHNFKNLTNK